MPHVTINREIRNQLKNGEDFTANPSEHSNFLLGIVGERIQAIHDVAVYWSAISTQFDSWTLTNNGAVDTLTRSSPDWIDDEFAIGDLVEFLDYGNNVPFGQATILSLTGTTMQLTTIGFGVYPQTLAGTSLHGLTPLTGIEYFYGFIENQEAINFNSKIDTEEQYLYAFGVGFDTGGGVRSTAPVQATFSGNINSWKMGSLTCAYLSTSADGYTQSFRFIHETIILPYYLDGQDINLLNPLVQPPLFHLNESLKYSFKAIFHDITTNPNNAHPALVDDLQGDVGYYQERFSGFQPVYSITSFTFSSGGNPVGGIQLGAPTDVEIVVASDDSTFSVDDRFSVFFSYLPDQASYQGTTTNFEANFLYTNVVNTVGSAPLTTSMLQNVEATLNSAAQITINLTVDLTLAQQLLIDPARNVVLWIMVHNESYPTGISDRMALLVSVGPAEFDADVPDLLSTDDKFGFREHDQLAGTLTNDYKGWVQDGIIFEGRLFVNIALNARILNYTWRLVAYNAATGDTFDLETIDVNLTDQTLINASPNPDYQEFTVAYVRSLQLLPNDAFGAIVLRTININPTTMTAIARVGFKMRWEEWIALPNANTVFFNNSQPNQGLNHNTSRYSLQNGYAIHVFTDFIMSNGVSLTNYRIRTPELQVLDFDDDGSGGADWSATITTFDQNGFDLQGNLHGSQNTVLKALFTHSAPPIAAVVDPWSIIRLDVDQGGMFTINELSDFQANLSPQPLVPLPLESTLKVTTDLVLGTILLECEVDYNQLQLGVSYTISARQGGQV